MGIWLSMAEVTFPYHVAISVSISSGVEAMSGVVLENDWAKSCLNASIFAWARFLLGGAGTKIGCVEICRIMGT